MIVKTSVYFKLDIDKLRPSEVEDVIGILQSKLEEYLALRTIGINLEFSYIGKPIKPKWILRAEVYSTIGKALSSQPVSGIKAKTSELNDL
jgi:hypothetical protein